MMQKIMRGDSAAQFSRTVNRSMRRQWNRDAKKHPDKYIGYFEKDKKLEDLEREQNDYAEELLKEEKRMGSINVANREDPRVVQIIDLLKQNPRNKKEIANKCGVQLGHVHRVYQLYFQGKGQFNNQQAPKELETVVEQQQVVQDVPEELEEEEWTPVEEQPKRRTGGKAIDDETIIAMIEYIEKEKPAMIDVCNKFNISEFTVRKYCAEYNVDCPKGSGKKRVIVITNKGGENEMARGRKRKAIPKGKNIEELAEELVGKKPPVEEVPVIIEEQTPPVEEEENVVAPVVEEDPLAAHELARGGQKETVDYPVDDFQEIQYESAVNTALILDRHEMPVNKGIFEIEIPKAKMFDYEWYDNIVRNWIFHNVPQNEDGLWEKPLNVYVTGLPAATASVIKTCNDMRVNLTLMHFNYDTRNFEKQVIFNKFPMAQDGVGLGSIFEGDKVKLYHTNVNAIENSNLFYCISKKELVRAKDNQFTTIEHYVTENFNDVWKVFPQLVEDIQKDTSKKICLFCNEVCKRTDGSFFFRKTITKSWNYSLAN